MIKCLGGVVEDRAYGRLNNFLERLVRKISILNQNGSSSSISYLSFGKKRLMRTPYYLRLVMTERYHACVVTSPALRIPALR